MLCSGKGGRKEGAYVLTPSGALVLPVMRRSQASLHSLMTSSAYFLFLHSPLNANEFSCFPSGIYHQHQNTENTTTTNNRFLHFQCWDLYLVDSPEFIGGPEETREMPLDIFNVI